MACSIAASSSPPPPPQPVTTSNKPDITRDKTGSRQKDLIYFIENFTEIYLLLFFSRHFLFFSRHFLFFGRHIAKVEPAETKATAVAVPVESHRFLDYLAGSIRQLDDDGMPAGGQVGREQVIDGIACQGNRLHLTFVNVYCHAGDCTCISANGSDHQRAVVDVYRVSCVIGCRRLDEGNPVWLGLDYPDLGGFQR